MQKFQTLPDAIALAEFAHRNQVDKAGLPYIDHPRRVLAKVQAQGALPFVQIAAILHDVTEDTTFTPDMLGDLGFSEAVVNLVRLLDRGESRQAFHNSGGDVREKDLVGRFYYSEIRKNQYARMIKFADIDDNMEEWRLSYLDLGTQVRLREKYYNALRMLKYED